MKKLSLFKRTLAILMTLTLIAGLLPMGTMADGSNERSATVYLTVSDDGGFYISPITEKTVSRIPVTVPYFDLADYGLGDYNIDYDGNDAAGQPYGGVKTPTLLHLLLQATKQFYDASFSASGDSAFTIAGSSGGAYMTGFWGHDQNLMYYVDHKYPITPGTDNWGATSDIVLLEDGMEIDLAIFSNWNFWMDGYFSYFETDDTSVQEGQSADFKLLGSPIGGAMGMGSDEPVPVDDKMSVFCVTDVTTMADSVAITDIDSEGNFSYTFGQAGTYYLVALDNNKGTADAVIAPAITQVTVTKPQITVSVGAYDYTAVTYGSDKASSNGIVLEQTEVAVDSDATALDAIKAVLDSNHIPYTVDTAYNYISSLNGLGEFGCGGQSGWLFSINDNFGNMGAALTTLSAGDRLNMHYSVIGWGTDVGGYWSGGPALSKISLGGTDTVISSHTVYADPDYIGTTTYYLGPYVEGGDNVPLAGMGTLASPYAIPIEVSAGMDITDLTAQVESTLHPAYMSYGSGDGLADISQSADYTQDVTFCLQTIGGYYKTYYTLSVTQPMASPLPDYTGDWTSFRGNDQNMGATNAKTPRTADETMLKWAVKPSDSWSESITPPIILNGYLYIAKGNRIVKIDPQNGEIVASSADMAGSVGYALNPVTYGGGMIFVPIGLGRVQALRADTLESLWVSEQLGGQTLTPATYRNGYIYTGTWNSEIKSGTYFCLSVTDEDPSKTNETKACTWKLNHNGGFYWAGAYATDQYVIFGGDDGDPGSTSETAVLYSVNPTTGAVIDTIEGVKGDIRSTVSYDIQTDRIYFTTKGGSFYQVKVNADGTFDDSRTKLFDLGGMCTGTPLVYNGLAYLGVADTSQFSPEGHSYKIIDVTTTPMKEVGSAEIPGYVQTSALLSTACSADTNKVYVYATYNYTPGGIYVIEVEKTPQTDADGAAVVNVSGSHLFVPEGDKAGYCICSLVCDKQGTIYYKNDSGYLMAVAVKPSSGKAITAFDIGSSHGIINESAKTVSVQVPYNSNLAALTPTVTVSERATVSPASGVSVDFTNPVTYTVTAEDGSTQGYAVTVTKKSNSGDSGTPSDNLATDKAYAKASLLKAFNKCSQSDYTPANWALVQSAYNTGVANIEAATTYNGVYTALNNAASAIGAVELKSGSTITVCVSMEKFTLGQGYIIEPTLVKVPKYTRASQVITDLIEAKYPDIARPYRNTGDVENSFYLSYVYDTDTDVHVPAYILSKLGGTLDTRGSNTLLGEFDYSSMSGWMYSVDGSFPGMGASSWPLSNREVMRWQFTLYGYGADLDADNGRWAQGSIKDLADKDALTWRVAEINGGLNGKYTKSALLAVGSNQEKYDKAMQVLTKIDSTQNEVDNALAALNNLQTPGSPGNTSGPDTGTGDGKGMVITPGQSVPTATAAPAFGDVSDSHWAKDYIAYLTGKGIISGRGNNLFAPDDTITRAEFIAILARISGAGKVGYSGGFDDVSASDWFADSVAWAVKNDITKGIAPASFAPNSMITRQDMATLIVRFTQYMAFDLALNNARIIFADDASIAEYAKEAVAKMQQAGIISGQGDNMFMPRNNTTRAEAAKMLAILMQKMGR